MCSRPVTCGENTWFAHMAEPPPLNTDASVQAGKVAPTVIQSWWKGEVFRTVRMILIPPLFPFVLQKPFIRPCSLSRGNKDGWVDLSAYAGGFIAVVSHRADAWCAFNFSACKVHPLSEAAKD